LRISFETGFPANGRTSPGTLNDDKPNRKNLSPGAETLPGLSFAAVLFFERIPKSVKTNNERADLTHPEIVPR